MVRDRGDGAVARVRAWVLDRPPAQWLSGGFLVVLLVSGLFGGLDEVESPPTPALVVGQAVATGPLTVRVDKVYWTTVIPGIPRPEGAPAGTGQVYPTKAEGARLLVVEGVVTNPTDTTVYGSIVRDAVRIDGASGFVDRDDQPIASSAARPTWTFLMPENSPVGSVQPGLGYRVLWAWDQPKGSAAPSTLGLIVNGHTWRQSTLDFSWGWFDPEVIAEADMPIATQTNPEPTS